MQILKTYSSLVLSTMLLFAFNATADTALDRSDWVLSSSHNEATLNNAIDDSLLTRWDSRQKQTPEMYFQIDFGSEQTINGLHIDSDESANDFPRAYVVFAGNDPNSLNSSIASGDGSGANTTIEFAPITARYVQIMLTGSDSFYWWSIHDIQVFSPSNALDRSGWSLSSSTNESDLDNAIDGNNQTRWTSFRQAQTPGQYVQVDMGGIQTFNKVLLDSSGSANDQPASYEVYASNNDANFGEPIVSGSGSSDGLTEINFSNISARYLRVVQTGSKTRNWWSVHEINIFSSASNSGLPDSFERSVTYDNETVNVNFTKFSSRGPIFSAFSQQADGSSVEVATSSEIRTYIGLVDGHPDAFASALIRSSGEILATVAFPTSKTWTDIDGVVTEQARDFDPLMPTEILTQKAGSNLYAADIYFDIPNPYIVSTGGTVAQAIEMIEFSMTSINAIYMRDAAVINRVGKMLFRSDPNQDIYTGIRAHADMLDILRGVAQNEVNNPNPALDHDLATVVSTQIGGGGIASVGTIGASVSSNGAYANGNFTNPARHEFGHNWNVRHYQGGQHIESKTIMSGNGLSKFASPAIAKIIAHRNSRANLHLDNIGNVAPPLPPRAGDDVTFVDITTGTTTLNVSPLSNDNDVNGDTIFIVAADKTTHLGYPVTFNSTEINASFTNTSTDEYDWFRYTVEDETGLQSIGVVHIQFTELTPFGGAASSDSVGSLNSQKVISLSSDELLTNSLPSGSDEDALNIKATDCENHSEH